MRGHPRAQRFPKMENIVCHEKTRLKILLQDDFILENWVNLRSKVEKEIMNDLRHILTVFKL